LINILGAFSVGYEDALKASEHHIFIHDRCEFTISEYFEIKDPVENTLAYVFQLEPAGFIAVSSDNAIRPVIGYSFLNNFSNKDTPTNIGYQFLKSDQKLRLEAIPLTSESLKESNRHLWEQYLNSTYEYAGNRDNIYPPEGYSSTEGWVETRWDLYEPYNNFCPIDPETGIRCSDCCVALAQAQIINYHRYIGDVSFTDEDDYVSTGSYPNIIIDNDYLTYDFPSFPQLNQYLTDLDLLYDNYDDIAADLIPALAFASCIALEIDFTYPLSYGNGSLIPARIIQKFNYDSASLYYSSNTQFYTLLRNDMVEARPAGLSISSPSMGHVVVCDGYNGNDDMFHINMGFSGSSDGWYSLPDGMPMGYHTVSRGYMNIEGGAVPFNVSGQIIADGVPVEETQLIFNGPRYHEFSNVGGSGYFEIPILFPGDYEVTAFIELDEGGYFHKNEVIYLDEFNSDLEIVLDSYEYFTGTVSAPVSPENTQINIYQDDVTIRSDITDEYGDFTVPGILPGDYRAVAGLDGIYFGIEDVLVTADDQHVDLDLEEYSFEYEFNFAGEPVGTLQLFQYMSCAIKLSSEELNGHTDNFIPRLEFIAPFEPSEGELHAQIWKDDQLMSEKEIEVFSVGEPVEVVMNDIILVDDDSEYYIGYRLHSLSGNVAAAYHDAGPRVEGKGAFINISSWMPLPEIHDFNFCIKGFILSNDAVNNYETEMPATELILFDNYPNPFNPSTIISFELSENISLEEVELTIYNIKGQKVKALNIEDCKMNINSAVWNGDDDLGEPVTSGIYFYKLKTGGFEQTRKMILLK